MTTDRNEPGGGRPAPPVANKVSKEDVLHGETRRDEYFWMREKDSPDVLAYLRDENAYTDAMMKHTAALQETLYREMLARIKETDLTVPFEFAGYYWYMRTEQGKQYPIYCRRKGSLDAPEEVTLDLNELAKGEKFVGLGAFEISNDGNWLAYSLDTTGFRVHTLYIKDLRTGEVGPERIERVDSAAWAADNETIFYVVENDAKRPCCLHRHRRGTTGADPMVYEETDEMFVLGVERTRSREWILVHSHSHTSSEVRFLPADSPLEAPRLIAPRGKDHEYDVDHRGGLFYIRTNDGGRRNFRIVTAPVSDPGPGNWTELMAHREEVMIEGLSLFRDHAVVFEREGGVQQLRIVDAATGASHRVEFPEVAYSVFPAGNPGFESGAYRYVYQSFTTPPSVYDYEIATRRKALLKQEEVLGDFDPARYQTERLQATAPDGETIPISLVSLKGRKRDGTGAMLLMGYGAYGYPWPITFSSNRMSLLDRGVTIAVAHVRGGGEMGKRWHDGGRMLAKKNTFTDFIAAADFLVETGYASRERLVIQGGSAGGLLIGAVVNLRPDLCGAAMLLVPFVDVINSMLDTSLPLTVGEFEEWGNPQLRGEYDVMRAYSPYDNLEAKPYPAMLVKSSYNDSQVMYWEPAKYVARLRTTKTDVNPLLLRMDMDPAGHGGKSGRYDRLRDLAFEFAYILDRVGIGE